MLNMRKAPYSPGEYSVVHTEVNVIRYIVCEVVDVLPVRITELLPHS